METVKDTLTKLLQHKQTDMVLKIYLINPRFWLYIIICGIGVLINMFVIHLLINYFPLWISNFFAILTAFLWNYINTLGKLRKYWGLE